MIVQLHSLGQALILTARTRLRPDSEILFANLLYLVAERGKQIPRERLLELFWPGRSDRAGRHCLRQMVYKLRQHGVPIVSSPSGVELPAEKARADYDPLLDGAAAGGDITADAIHGEFLPHYAPGISPAFAEWVEQHRAHVNSHVRRALLAELGRLRAQARWADVERVARRCLELDALNEEATLALAEATAFAGGKAEAVRILDRYLDEIGTRNNDIRLPASILRRRIAERIPAQPYVARADQCFVGREEEIAFLSQLLQTVRGGERQTCIIWGEPGIGKTRLLAEFTKVAVMQGAAVQRVPCQPTDLRRPMSVFVDMVPLLLGMPGALGCSPEAMGHLTKLTGHSPYAADSRSAGEEAPALWAMMRQSLVDLLEAILSEQPVVLMLEDVHWLDDASLRLLRELLTTQGLQRLMLILTARPTGNGSDARINAAADGVPTRRMRALSGAAADALLDALTASSPKPMSAEARAWCINVSEGRPYFLSELATHWMNTGRTSPAPSSLTEMLSQRISALTRDASQTLQASAILGKNATVSRLDRVLGLTPSALLAALQELEGAGLVHTSDSIVRPRHDLVAETAETVLAESPRQLLHLRAARLLDEELRGSRSAAVLWDCVQHYQKAGERDRVVALVTHCAEHLQQVGLPGEALEVLRKAQDLCASPEERLGILEATVSALIAAASWEEVIPTLKTKAHLKRQVSGSPSRHSNDEFDLLQARWRCGYDIRKLLADARQCSRDEDSDSDHRLRAALWALIFADNLGSERELEEIFTGSQKLLRRPYADRGDALFAQVVYHSSAGDLDTAVSCAQELVHTSRQQSGLPQLIRALKSLNIPLRRAGRTDEACAASEEVYTLAVKYNLPSTALGAAEQIAWTLLDVEDFDGARGWRSRMLQWEATADDRIFHYASRGLVARMAILEGDWSKASELDVANEQHLSEPAGRQRIIALSYWAQIRAKQLPYASVEQRHLDDFTGLYRALRSMGNQDYAVASLCLLLHRLGKSGEATALLGEYINRYRRERYAPPRFLTGFASQGRP